MWKKLGDQIEGISFQSTHCNRQAKQKSKVAFILSEKLGNIQNQVNVLSLENMELDNCKVENQGASLDAESNEDDPRDHVKEFDDEVGFRRHSLRCLNTTSQTSVNIY